MILAAVSNPGNPELTQLVLSVASGGTLLVLTFIAGYFRKFLKEHSWLMERVNEHSKAIESLLETNERRNKRYGGSRDR